MKKSIIAASVIAALSFNATASDLEAYEPVNDSSSMSTSDKVAAGVFSAAAVGIALLSSSSC
jgi:nucleoside-specific outer membrane channel protein Tsx